jgi:hypothetical protein
MFGHGEAQAAGAASDDGDLVLEFLHISSNVAVAARSARTVFLVILSAAKDLLLTQIQSQKQILRRCAPQNDNVAVEIFRNIVNSENPVAL